MRVEQVGLLGYPAIAALGLLLKAPWGGGAPRWDGVSHLGLHLRDPCEGLIDIGQRGHW